MQARAIPLGKELVEEERALNHLFASRSVTPEALSSSLARIGKLQGQVRQVHLEAHIEQTAMLLNRLETTIGFEGYATSVGNHSHEQRRH